MALRPGLTYLEMCAGIGGLGLGLSRAVPGARCLGYVERDAFAASVLVMPQYRNRQETKRQSLTPALLSSS